MVDIEDLEAELQKKVQALPSFKNSGFSIFDTEDLEGLSSAQNYPLAGVSYDGAIPQAQKGNEASPVAQNAGAARLITVQFTIIIAVQYHIAGDVDTKKHAMRLLKEVRGALLGFKEVNARPWQFVGERPEFGVSGNGVVYYSQVWQTVIANTGN
jgi:hypothetical protein